MIVKPRLRSDPWQPRKAWREDDVLQWGTPRHLANLANQDDGSGIARLTPDGVFDAGPAFFEVFPREGSYVRGEGASLDDAEAVCFEKIQRHRACEHAFSRKFLHGLGQCRNCGATRPVFQPVVEIGAWKQPLTGRELNAVFNGSLEPVDNPHLSGPEWDKRSRQIWLRARLNGIHLPPIPDVPKEFTTVSPFQRACAKIALELLRSAGGAEAIERGEIVIDGRVVSKLTSSPP